MISRELLELEIINFNNYQLCPQNMWILPTLAGNQARLVFFNPIIPSLSS